MAEEEKARVEEGLAPTHEVSGSSFLLLGMSIENTQ